MAVIRERGRGDGPRGGPGRTRRRLGPLAAATLVLGVGCADLAEAAAKLRVILSFGGGRGNYPAAAPVADSAGDLYVTSKYGGAYGDGAVVELSPPAPGQKAWFRTVIHTFDLADGAYPAASLVVDAAGNLYGVAGGGGAFGDGVAFELSPPAARQRAWKETVLHAFGSLGGTDGQDPSSPLTPDGAGGFYGVASAGGAHGDGVFYQLSPPPEGQKAWTETVLYSFAGADGQAPQWALAADGRGGFYGTTFEGGANRAGVAYQLSPPASGQSAWTLTVLHAFDGYFFDGPTSGLVMDGAGNLYGTTGGGAEAEGQAYELSPPGQGETRWSWTVVRTFNEHLEDPQRGLYPQGGLIADTSGNLYGVTYRGGAYNYGVVFELSPPRAGAKHWEETVLHAFDAKHGGSPEAGLIGDGAGGFYGTAPIGGSNDDGVVFALAP